MSTKRDTDPGLGGPRPPPATPTVDENGNVRPRSFDTLVPTPEPDAVVPDTPGTSRQADTGESLKRLEEKRDAEARARRNQTLGLVAAFVVVLLVGLALIKLATGPGETQPTAAPPTVTITVPVVTTVTVPATTETQQPTATVPVTATATAPSSVTAKPSATVKASASAAVTATAPTATATTTTTATPSAKPSASHDPDYIRDFHP